MSADRNVFHNAVAALRHRVLTIFIVLATLTTPAFAADPLDDAFARLAAPTGEGWRIAEADILREWSRSGSPSMDLLLQRGEAALDQGDIDGAIGHLTALIDHAPDFAAAYQARAAAHAAAGLTGPALSDLGRALELEPRHFVALTQLGAMLEELGQPDRALTAYRESLAIHPHQQEAIDGVARLERARIGTDI
ncbi:tetratricopeptide repeat protein [Paracoccus sp. 1_MG-2023]|uniref:tetratricopeptide repeat protein n=1 Tax=unclassified Paracoccus (in: a-proteobacteria) TaxID=2688777 RepID=UPI001C087771|nr:MULTISPECIES: tetratricopeptide repeat protein [unclassified Paracoccus (in: a-proteobacteria)]MBU2956736.1 tetratricopeptide repeat protein [Paracoccus sp. C2R09]MDO6669225.1 tetratricopeptide repeat protein [Paracoccus sp. 1_MG-2023]